MNHSRRITRTATSLFLAAVALVWLSTSGTLGGFTKGSLANTTTSVRAAKLSITNSVGGSGCTATASGAAVPTACTASLYPTSATTAGSAATNNISNSGTVPAATMTSKYKVAGCGPVSLANTAAAGSSGPMLPRNGTTFAPSAGPFSGSGGSIVLDGKSGSYAASTAAITEPTLGNGVISTKTFGLGIWFRTSTTTGPSPLFSFSASPLVDTTAQSDRTLYLDAAGRIAYIPEAGRSTAIGIAAGAARYNDGNWHFAYVSINGNAFGYTTRLYVDAKIVTTLTGGTTLDSYSGYWHAGWAPTVVSGGAYFAGSLAGFVVDSDGAATTPTTVPTTYAFDAAPTQEWDMADSGGSFDGTNISGVYTGSYPSGAGNPCASINISWTMMNPTATVFPGSPTLASLTTSSASIADPEPGTSQTSTVSLSHASTINTYLVGLIVYAPVVSTYSAGSWQVSFMWNAPAAGTTAGSTFLVK